MNRYRYSDSELKFLEECSIPFAVYQFINQRVVTIALSKGFCEFLGLKKMEDAYELMDNNMYRDTHPDDQADLADAAYRFAKDGGNYDVIYRVMRNGKYRIVHAYGRHIFKEDGTRLAVVLYTDLGLFEGDDKVTDSSTVLTLRNMLEERSFNRRVGHDALTGLPSMTYFFDLAEAGCKEMRDNGKTPALLFMDFNGMKSYNRKYGLEGGDKYLIAFKDILVKYFTHDNCSRFSADHFCVYTDAQTALENAEKVVRDVAANSNDSKMPLRIGIYEYEDENISISAACDRAKMACDSNRKVYESRIYHFSKDMMIRIENRQYIVENIDRAIENKWIRVCYQPLVRTANGRVCGEEALARWFDPEKGLISPADFIPDLEEANSIYKLDLFVLENVIEKMKVMEEHELFLVPHSVNLSRSDFYTCDIVEEIRRRVDKAGIPRDRFVFEITESTVAGDVDYMIGQIRRFKELGFSVWMDDYGSGYSSPIMLQNIPFDLLKIDMQFVRQMDKAEKAKIILTETVRMAMSLGMDTIAEGVETPEQAEFLKEIGCTTLQGYYYCKPVFLEEILDRYNKGIQIGFENPAETEYFSQVGRVSLFDISISRNDEDRLKDYFDTWPMVIVECRGNEVSIIKCNGTFREFFRDSYTEHAHKQKFVYRDDYDFPGSYALRTIVQCGRDGNRSIIDDRTPQGRTVQVFIRRIAVNPVTGASAVGVVLLSIADSPTSNRGLSYNYIARALSEDYIFLYFIDMNTGEFTEYSPDGANRDVSIERHGKDFFAESLEVASNLIYKDDLEDFLKVFSKKNIEKSLKENGTFTLTYRNMIDGEPVYVNMKIVKIRGEDDKVILGINNVDAQMKHKAALEKIREERLTYSRIRALSGDYIAMYTVDVKTDEYYQASSSDDYDSVGVKNEVKNFYEAAIEESDHAIYKDDVANFKKQFRKDKIIKAIKQKGLYTINYRLLIDGKPTYVLLKATMVNENDKDYIIMGVINVDDEVRREQEYAANLHAARAEVDLDELTGVKSKHAYVDAETSLDREIEEGKIPMFAVAVFDINGLKEINDTYGHQAGDQYIIDGCQMICKCFKRSPVYRVGGDEFAVILQGSDYNKLDEHMKRFRKLNEKNRKAGLVVVAAGVQRFTNESSVAAVFKLADEKMYVNKRSLKSG